MGRKYYFSNKEYVETIMQLREDVFDDMAGNIQSAEDTEKEL